MDESKPKDVTRRDLIKYAGMGIATVAVIGTGCSAVDVVSDSVDKSTGSGKNYAMVIDLKRCNGCHSCSVACKSEYDVPLGSMKSTVKYLEKGVYPKVERLFLPRLCNNCSSPPCVPVCPTDASHIRANGIVAITEKECIGCERCIEACPYSARYMHPVKEIAQKCDFCMHRVENGTTPSCVNTCPSEARIFGDLNNRHSEVAKILAKGSVLTRKPDLGTKPKVYYVNADKAAIKAIDEG